MRYCINPCSVILGAPLKQYEVVKPSLKSGSISLRKEPEVTNQAHRRQQILYIVQLFVCILSTHIFFDTFPPKKVTFSFTLNYWPLSQPHFSNMAWLAPRHVI